MTGDNDAAETVRGRLQADLRGAMKRRDRVEISTLRCLIAAVDNAGAVEPTTPSGVRDWSKSSIDVAIGDGPSEVARRTLSWAEVAAILKREWDARDAASATLESHGRSGAAERAEMAVISRYFD